MMPSKNSAEDAWKPSCSLYGPRPPAIAPRSLDELRAVALRQLPLPEHGLHILRRHPPIPVPVQFLPELLACQQCNHLQGALPAAFGNRCIPYLSPQRPFANMPILPPCAICKQWEPAVIEERHAFFCEFIADTQILC